MPVSATLTSPRMATLPSEAVADTPVTLTVASVPSGTLTEPRETAAETPLTLTVAFTADGD